MSSETIVVLYMINKKLQKELLKMMKADQQMRFNPQKNSLKFSFLDKENTETLKRIIAKYGWPHKKLVGAKGVLAAWLIAQHADHDLKFQKQCLSLMQKEVLNKGVNLPHVALLTDRVLVNSKKPQKYGTQFYTTKQGVYTFRPIADRKNLDIRRKEAGLEPFEVYHKHMTATRQKHKKKYKYLK